MEDEDMPKEPEKNDFKHLKGVKLDYYELASAYEKVTLPAPVKKKEKEQRQGKGKEQRQGKGKEQPEGPYFCGSTFGPVVDQRFTNAYTHQKV